MSASDTDWLQLAEEDLEMAHVLLASSVPPRGPAFHAQRAVEKSLKALLVAQGLRVPKVHDILALVRRLPAVAGLPPDDELNVLSDYAVDAQYPDDMIDVYDEDARAAVETAEAVLAAVREALA